MEPIQVGFLSIVPPLIAIGLALITKEVISSLVIGIFSGTLIYSFYTQSGVVAALGNVFNLMSENFSVTMIIFLALLGALVAVITMAGGSRAYGEWASSKINNRTGAQLATSALGCIIFIDDYFNCLTVGTVMKPVTDKHNISRAKLAYLIDATAAPVCIIAPISSWAASVISYLADTGLDGMGTFVATIPYNLYAVLTIVMIIVLSVTNLEFGPMQRFERNAIEKGDLHSGRGEVLTDELANAQISNKGKVMDLIVPILSLIVFSVLAMLYTGGYFEGGMTLFEAFGDTDANLALAMGGFGAIVVAFIFFLSRKVLSFKEFMSGITIGIKSMVPAFIILTLAWTIKGVCSSLSAAEYVSALVGNTLYVGLIPAIVFVVAAFLSFSTGTSWGTFGILIPIIAMVCQTVAPHLTVVSLAATLAGSVYGDHCSPISDTTILSSTGAGCDHIDHVSSQLPYASLVAVCCFVGYLVAGLTGSLLLTLGVSLLLLLGSLFLLHKRSVRVPQKV